ncbi:conserved hypothetical protein [Vibrio crassostreae]|nr:conserved hypothetical protein [Vibrio chagasii]CAK2850724.1 conserved hypothetical protein [Vibrio crassostreae]
MIDMKKSTIAVTILGALTMAGCSTTPTEQYVEHKQEVREKAYSKEEQKFASVPKWFLNQPKNDDSGVYAVGTATSNNLQFSMNHAKLNAEFSIAKSLNQELSGRERAFMSSDSNGNVSSDAESVVTKFVDSADIVGVDTVENEVQLNEGKYTVYTLVYMSYEQQANILGRKAGNTTRNSAKQAYAEIEAELRRRADERKQLELDKAAAEAEAKARVDAEIKAQKEDKAKASATTKVNQPHSSTPDTNNSVASELLSVVKSSI